MRARPAEAVPGLAPDQRPEPEPGRQLEVDGEVFVVSRRTSRGRLVEYDYAWLSGPNEGYGFGLSGPLHLDEEDHAANIRGFLAEIDPETGYLAE